MHSYFCTLGTGGTDNCQKSDIEAKASSTKVCTVVQHTVEGGWNQTKGSSDDKFLDAEEETSSKVVKVLIH